MPPLRRFKLEVVRMPDEDDIRSGDIHETTFFFGKEDLIKTLFECGTFDFDLVKELKLTKLKEPF